MTLFEHRDLKEMEELIEHMYTLIHAGDESTETWVRIKFLEHIRRRMEADLGV